MWRSAKFIDDNVAFSRMPTRSEIDEVAETFDAVVVLVEEFELHTLLASGGRSLNIITLQPDTKFMAPTIGQFL